MPPRPAAGLRRRQSADLHGPPADRQGSVVTQVLGRAQVRLAVDWTFTLSPGPLQQRPLPRGRRESAGSRNHATGRDLRTGWRGRGAALDGQRQHPEGQEASKVNPRKLSRRLASHATVRFHDSIQHLTVYLHNVAGLHYVPTDRGLYYRTPTMEAIHQRGALPSRKPPATFPASALLVARRAGILVSAPHSLYKDSGKIASDT